MDCANRRVDVTTKKNFVKPYLLFNMWDNDTEMDQNRQECADARFGPFMDLKDEIKIKTERFIRLFPLSDRQLEETLTRSKQDQNLSMCCGYWTRIRIIVHSIKYFTEGWLLQNPASNTCMSSEETNSCTDKQEKPFHWKHSFPDGLIKRRLSHLSEFGQQQQHCLPYSVFDSMLQGVAMVTHFRL